MTGSSFPPGFLDVILRAHELSCENLDEDRPESGLLGDGIGHLQQILARVDEDYYGEARFPSLEEKAGILLKELVEIHPFVDGKKRTALVAVTYFLMWHRRPLTNTTNEASMVRRIADKSKRDAPSFDEIVDWIRTNSQPFDVARLANRKRFARYRQLGFEFDLERRDARDRSEIAVQVHAVDSKTRRRVGRKPFLQRVLGWATGRSDPNSEADDDPGPTVVPAQDDENQRVRRLRKLRRKKDKNKRSRKSRR